MRDWFQRVGWVERSETHQSLRGAMMGIASLYPSDGPHSAIAASTNPFGSSQNSRMTL